jgi:carbonic anhydrase/acetyltransferase-like protein (isoleucine patch superfamily)
MMAIPIHEYHVIGIGFTTRNDCSIVRLCAVTTSSSVISREENASNYIVL